MTHIALVLAASILVAGGHAAAQDVAPDPSGTSLQAQTAAPAPALRIELNAAEPQPEACRLVFLAENGLGADLSSLVIEAVVFDQAGKVMLLTLFDFRDVPDARSRVRQFDIAGTDCAAVGRVLLNDVHACVGTGITQATCKAGLTWSSRTDVEVLG